jgi:nitrate reductase gamma subunit
MIFEHPRRLIAFSIFLMVFGFVMPFLMTLKLVESTLFLNFFSFGASVLGLMLGLVGIAGLQIKEKKKKEDEENYRY